MGRRRRRPGNGWRHGEHQDGQRPGGGRRDARGGRGRVVRVEDDVEVEVHTAIFTDATMQPLLTGHAAAAHQTDAISGEQAEAWVSEQTQRAAAGRLMVAIPMFLAAATR